jgi:hypothetical protein
MRVHLSRPRVATGHNLLNLYTHHMALPAT